MEITTDILKLVNILSKGFIEKVFDKTKDSIYEITDDEEVTDKLTKEADEAIRICKLQFIEILENHKKVE